jgi:hypothetical protein
MQSIAIKGVALYFLLLAGTLSAQEPQGPRIEVKEEQYSMGSVAQGQQATHVFKVKNAGAEPLLIERVQSS